MLARGIRCPEARVTGSCELLGMWALRIQLRNQLPGSLEEQHVLLSLSRSCSPKNTFFSQKVQFLNLLSVKNLDFKAPGQEKEVLHSRGVALGLGICQFQWKRKVQARSSQTPAAPGR